MTEPIEKITDETVALIGHGSDCESFDYTAKMLDEPYRTMLLTSAAKDARIKELEADVKQLLSDNEAYKTQLTETVKSFDTHYEVLEAHAKLEENLKEAMRLLDKSQPATSGDSAGNQRDAGDWWLALKKLKAE